MHKQTHRFQKQNYRKSQLKIKSLKSVHTHTHTQIFGIKDNYNEHDVKEDIKIIKCGRNVQENVSFLARV